MGGKCSSVFRAAPMHVFTGPYSSHMAFFEMADEFNRLTFDFLEKHSA